MKKINHQSLLLLEYLFIVQRIYVIELNIK